MTANRLRTFGIDPGYARCGWAVVDNLNGRLRLVASGCLEIPARQNDNVRLVFLHQQMKKLLAKYSPDRVAVERLFFSKNVSTAMMVGQARGVVLLAAGQVSLPIIELTPTMIKQAVTGHGRADKGQIQRMMKALLRLPRIPRRDDEADAMAAAYCAAPMPNPS